MMDTITGAGTAISRWDGALITLGTIHGTTVDGTAGTAHGTIVDGIHRGTVDGTAGTVHGITVAGTHLGIMADGMIPGIMATADTVVVITMGSMMVITAV